MRRSWREGGWRQEDCATNKGKKAADVKKQKPLGKMFAAIKKKKAS
jgi:hypothetical protein